MDVTEKAPLLLVPIQVDVLHLPVDQVGIEPSCDFSRQPYKGAQFNENTDMPPLSEQILSQPFANQNFTLKAGTHLHWSLPDALTKSMGSIAQSLGKKPTDFPGVPNRWLIIKKDDTGNILQQWVVESDYLHPAGTGQHSTRVNIPYFEDSQQPFRYLGQAISLRSQEIYQPKPDTSPQSGPKARYWGANLTAVGYGDPTFAAFYPNCHSVFGCRDPDINIPETGVVYDVIGWYSDAKNDHLSTFLNYLKGLQKNTDKNLTESEQQQMLQTLQEELKRQCHLDVDLPKAILTADTRLLCYGRITVGKDTSSTDNSPQLQAHSITVANTGTEALASHLAQKLAADNSQLNAVTVEEQLETLLLTSHLEHRQLDINAKLQQARHHKGFTAISQGIIWSIRSQQEPASNGATKDGSDGSDKQITLPPEMAHKLNALNQLQQDYNRTSDQVTSQQQHLFSQWYKYALCAYPPSGQAHQYPDIDLAKHFVTQKGLLALQKAKANLGTLALQRQGVKDNGPVTAALAPDSASYALASRCAQQINALLKELQDLQQHNQDKNAQETYRLVPIAAPRYWQANEPVVLIEGEVAQPTDRHDHGDVICHMLPACSLQELLNTQFAPVRKKIDELTKENTDGLRRGLRNWTGNAWHPFMLEWEVGLFPMAEKNHFTAANGQYDPDFINHHHELRENAHELTVKTNAGVVANSAHVYAGSTLLTPHAKKQTLDKMLTFLQEWLQALDLRGEQANELKTWCAKFEQDDMLQGDIESLKNWYVGVQKLEATSQLTEPFCLTLCAFAQLQQFKGLSQTLGGFHAALLMHKQTRQLQIMDPLGFEPNRTFAGDLQEIISNQNRLAPSPRNAFNPIRAGVLKVRRLRLVDTFGQVASLDTNNIHTSQQMLAPGSRNLAALPTRLMQPARLNLRWLSADHNLGEMNSHPASSPICGWMVPNYLDSSLMIYSSKGQALGIINLAGNWQAAPGQSAAARSADIDNIYLQKLIRHILQQDQSFLQDFLTGINISLQHIEPENGHQHTDLALLMGRPLAVVRASLDLQLQGLPASNQGWNSFHMDMQTAGIRGQRGQSHGFENITFPIRLGEYHQGNDGLVGYFKETADDYQDGTFYVNATTHNNDETAGDNPDTDNVKNTQIQVLYAGDSNSHVLQSFTSAPQQLTMLIDPRAVVHATCGILPAKEIHIPRDQYAQALQDIEVTFLTAPLLSDENKINLPLRKEPGYTWSYLENDQGSWQHTPQEAIGLADPQATFSGKQRIYDGWLTLKKRQTKEEIQ